MNDADLSQDLQARIEHATGSRTPLCIRAGGSKDFYAREPQGEILNLSGHRGIVSYEPTELVLTARAGTRLSEIEQTLAENNQMLAFEPPGFGAAATLGGTVACNFSGPRRPYLGAARDSVLGCKLLNGKGEIGAFGGQVMKNVAGYDVSRLMAGAMGTLGVLLEISLKVLPKPEAEVTLRFDDLTAQAALDEMHRFALRSMPLSAMTYSNGQLTLRLSGSAGAVKTTAIKIGGERLREEKANNFWDDLNNHRSHFFADERPLWRVSLASDNEPLPIGGDCLYEWGGAQRWLLSEATPSSIRQYVERVAGHAVLYRNGEDREQAMHPLTNNILALHQRLKQAFDPHRILNRGRMYAEL